MPLFGEVRDTSLKQLFMDENISDVGINKTHNRNSSNESHKDADSSLGTKKLRIFSQKAQA
jgi:hypothetical protein